MSPEAILRELDTHGAELWLTDAGLTLRSEGVIQAGLLLSLREHKAALLDYLRAPGTGSRLTPEFEEAAARCLSILLANGFDTDHAARVLQSEVPRGNLPAVQAFLADLQTWPPDVIDYPAIEPDRGELNFTTRQMATGFQKAHAGGTLPTELPTGPGSRILNPRRWYDLLEEAIAEGPIGDLWESGALLQDLESLAALVKASRAKVERTGTHGT